MERPTSSDQKRFGRWDDDSNRPHKKPRYSPTVIKDEPDSSTKMSIPDSDWWVVTSFLGQGSYGSVHLAVSTTVGEKDSLPNEMAIKTTEFSQASRLKKEERFLTCLKNSPHVVSYYGYLITRDKKTDKMFYNTILEYCPGQCLAKHIKSHKGGLAECDVKRLSIDILMGLKCIHGKKIIHGDIKPKNILLAADSDSNGFLAKISGFGRAMKKGTIEYGEGWGHRRGTTRFMSPELMGDMELDYCADVWAFGCAVLEMLTGERAWGEHGELDWEDWISLIGDSGLVPYVPDYLSENAKDFLSKCLERDPAQRWTVDSLIKHPFLCWNYEFSEDEEAEEEEMEEIEEVVEENEIGEADVEAYEPYIELEEEEEEEEEEDLNDVLGDLEIEAYEANLQHGEPFEEELEATEIDEEYPKEDSEEDI